MSLSLQMFRVKRSREGDSGQGSYALTRHDLLYKLVDSDFEDRVLESIDLEQAQQLTRAMIREKLSSDQRNALNQAGDELLEIAGMAARAEMTIPDFLRNLAGALGVAIGVTGGKHRGGEHNLLGQAMNILDDFSSGEAKHK